MQCGCLCALRYGSVAHLLFLTGASEPRNLGYMERLGLWGEGTPSFASFPDFLEAVGGRGVGALELVAMDMKARGMFVCRTLSFKGQPSSSGCLLAPWTLRACLSALFAETLNLKHSMRLSCESLAMQFPCVVFTFCAVWLSCSNAGQRKVLACCTMSHQPAYQDMDMTFRKVLEIPMAAFAPQGVSLRWWRRPWRSQCSATTGQLRACGISCAASSSMLPNRSGAFAVARVPSVGFLALLANACSNHRAPAMKVIFRLLHPFP